MAPLPEPRVTLKVEGEKIDFMVDMGAQNSMLLKADGPMTDLVSRGPGLIPICGPPKEEWT